MGEVAALRQDVDRICFEMGPQIWLKALTLCLERGGSLICEKHIRCAKTCAALGIAVTRNNRGSKHKQWLHDLYAAAKQKFHNTPCTCGKEKS
jgi:hypothetical protein